MVISTWSVRPDIPWSPERRSPVTSPTPPNDESAIHLPNSSPVEFRVQVAYGLPM